MSSKGRGRSVKVLFGQSTFGNVNYNLHHFPPELVNINGIQEGVPVVVVQCCLELFF